MLYLMLMQAAGPMLPDTRPPPEPCRPGEGGEVTVCGHRDDGERFRLHPLPQLYGDDPRDAVRLKLPGGVTLAPETVRGRMGEPQVVLTLKMPL